MRDLTKYRLDMAEERLDAAALMIDVGRYKLSISNSYYAIFNAARALLAERNVDFKKHSAVISYFRREYVKTGVFDVIYSKYIGSAFDSRNDCDYEDFFIASREQAQEQYQHAVEFCAAVKNFLEAT